MKTIWFVRHGESVADRGEATENPQFIFLSPAGITQAGTFAERFPWQPELILTSPYLPAEQTALKMIARFPEAATGIWECVREFVCLSPGRFVSTTSAERQPALAAYWQREDPDFVDGPGAESYRQLAARTEHMWELLSRRRERHILIFSHSRFISNVLLQYYHPGLAAETYMRLFPREKVIPPCTVQEVQVFQ